jgi:competence protein ComEA
MESTLLNKVLVLARERVAAKGKRPLFHHFYFKEKSMKAMHLFLAVLFTCTLCLFAASGEVFAASDKNQDSVAAETTSVNPDSNEKKKVAKVKKEIPQNVDINTADKALLTELPGIGPVTADAILAYRQDNGNFKSIDELTKVKGIGDKILAKLKPYLLAI